MHPPRVPRVPPLAREAGVTDDVNVNAVAWQGGWGAAFRKQITGEVEGEERALIREKKQAVEEGGDGCTGAYQVRCLPRQPRGASRARPARRAQQLTRFLRAVLRGQQRHGGR